MIDIEGCVAVVTGAGQGNGRALALGLARAGALVALCDVNGEKAGETAATIQAEGGRALAAMVDVADPAACRNFAARVRLELGDAAILVNNAGIIRRHGLDDPDFDSHWDATFQVNVHGTKNMVRAFVPQLEKTGGRIVNLASIMSHVAGPGIPAYVASKGAVAQFTKALAHELAPRGIRVNAIAPGVIDTPMTEATRGNEAAISRFMAHTPLGRTGRPEELVGPVLFLVSGMSSYVTGAILPVDGGYLAA
ncbi:SDR family NAD(P)-dependent oxidoreductase [Nitratireductor sp. ZSWI3]|uniref:SDR family NAD(P)-dependent oxidoreductase n=1 Tax=Nitratireductor sp. ZSWI3 TaxID=2966359 RepID=UPI002150336B|nr:glucose 1-dehydrogenase [Nitratireductor sp. ZSWI3]MCR4265450.1 glucose 1-dehydrogenase [Nitratireductor sp. ZSWI3]